MDILCLKWKKNSENLFSLSAKNYELKRIISEKIG